MTICRFIVHWTHVTYSHNIRKTHRRRRVERWYELSCWTTSQNPWYSQFSSSACPSTNAQQDMLINVDNLRITWAVPDPLAFSLLSPLISCSHEEYNGFFTRSQWCDRFIPCYGGGINLPLFSRLELCYSLHSVSFEILLDTYHSSDCVPITTWMLALNGMIAQTVTVCVMLLMWLMSLFNLSQFLLCC